MDTKDEKEKNESKKRLCVLEKQKTEIEQKLKIAKHYEKEENVVKNLRIFGNICNFLAPFILMAGVSVASLKLLGEGYPFIVDKVTKSKQYTLEIELDGIVNLEESYPWTPEIQEVYTLTEYTPWNQNDTIYKRKIKTYDIPTDYFPYILDAISTENLEEYLDETKINFKEEEETVNRQPILYEKSQITGTIEYIDNTDTITVSERSYNNIMTTTIEIILTGFSGALIACKRKYKFIKSIKKIIDEHRKYIERIEEMVNGIEEINQKILTLKKESDNL